MMTNKYSRDWSNNLKQSSLTPPSSIFPIVWTILYIMIAISGFSYIKNKKVCFMKQNIKLH